MKLTIVYDNEIYNKNPGTSDHGFSCFIETNEDNILFDTGTNGKILLENMKLLDKDPSKISKVVISHEHYDHNGGLPKLISFLPKDATIYRLEPNTHHTAVTEKQIKESIPITQNIFSTGRLKGIPVDEQSLLFKTKDGVVVLTGCSHPGVDHILRAAEKQGEVIGLIGGFHGFSDLKQLESLDFIYPCHCTAFKKEIKKMFPKTAFDCGIGRTITL